MINLEMEEGQRQMLIMALAHLAVERPGWDRTLNELAMKIDNVKEGRAQLYDDFKRLHKEQLEYKKWVG